VDSCVLYERRIEIKFPDYHYQINGDTEISYDI
jgi:hypothetical protein